MILYMVLEYAQGHYTRAWGSPISIFGPILTMDQAEDYCEHQCKNRGPIFREGDFIFEVDCGDERYKYVIISSTNNKFKLG